jgi:hypothetical protein
MLKFPDGAKRQFVKLELLELSPRQLADGTPIVAQPARAAEPNLPLA